MKNFNPRAPCGARPNCDGMDDLDDAFQPTRPLRGATAACDADIQPLPFQPTRPLRGATIQRSPPKNWGQDFNPRAPCGARPWLRTTVMLSDTFQPTRPLRGATALRAHALNRGKFQPTRPLRGATPVAASGDCSSEISTHAPLAGRDQRKNGLTCPSARFQPTRPLRGATVRSS